MNEQNQKQQILNAEQVALVTELTETYGIEPEDIIFFQNDKKPFLTYEANSVLCNYLTDLAQIGVEPVTSAFPDSVAVKCTILTAQGRERSAVGVANFGELLNETDIPNQQSINLASSRALRNVLRSAGIDLLKLHQQAMTGEVLDFKTKTNYQSLLRLAHKLGQEAFLIDGENKAAWYLQLQNRYGVNHSNELEETQLADFVAFLNTLVPQKAKAA